MVASTTRRSALALMAAGTVASIAAAEGAPKPKATAMTNIKQFCDRYYDAWSRKDLNAILACIDAGVVFKSPNATTIGRDAYAAGAQRFLGLVERVDVRHTFTAPDSAMAAVDFYCIQPIGVCPTAERIALKNGLIVEDELFFDVRPFEASARSGSGAGKTVMELRTASRWLLAVASVLLLAGGTFHTWAYSKATAMIDASNIPARNGALFKALWLVDSGEVLLIGLAFLALAWRPRLSNRATLGFLAALLIASTLAIYLMVGNFPPGHVLLVSAALAIVAALLPAGEA